MDPINDMPNVEALVWAGTINSLEEDPVLMNGATIIDPDAP